GALDTPPRQVRVVPLSDRGPSCLLPCCRRSEGEQLAMSAGDPDPQIPPMPDRSPEQVHKDQQAGEAASTSEPPHAGVEQHGAEQHGAEQSDPGQYSPDQYSPDQHGAAPAYGPDAQAPPPYAPSDDAYAAPAAFSQDTYGSAAAGDAVPQPAPAPGYSPGDALPTRRREEGKTGKSKLPLILSLSAVGVVLVLVVVGVLVVMNMNRTQYGPETVAQQYLDAVAAGDLAAA